MNYTETSPTPEAATIIPLTASERILKLLTAVNTITQRLLEADRWSDAVEQFLSDLGRASRAEQACLYQLTQTDPVTAALLARWPAALVERDPSLPELVAASLQAQRQQQPCWLEETQVPRLVAPVFARGSLWGGLVLALDAIVDERWSSEETAVIQSAANILGSVIGRSQSKPKLGRFLQTETVFQTILETTADRVAVVDQAGNYLFIKEGQGSYPVAEMPRTIYDEVPVQQQAAMRAVVDQVFVTNQPATFELSFPREEGGRGWYLNRVSPLCQNGQVVAVTITATDITARKRTELELEHIFSRSVDMQCLAGFDGYFKRINAAWPKTLGWTSEELLSRPYLDFVHQDDLEITAVEAGTLEQSKEARFVNRYRCKDGTYRWLSWTATVVEEEEIIIATARDITVEKQMRAELQASEARYQQMFTRHKAVMLLIDPKTGQIVDANPAAAEFYGYHHDKLVTLKITDINVLPALEVQAEMELARVEKRNFFVFPHRLASGEIRDVEVHSGPVDLQGQVLLISIIFDVTERKRAQLELQKSEARFRRLAEYAPVGIYESTVTGDFLYGNPALAKILQQDSVELMTQSFTTTFYKNPEDRADFISRLQQHGIVTDFEAEFSVKDGTKHVLMSAALQGETLLGTIVDITERKLAEKQLHQTLQNLERSNQDLQQFAYVASHDLQEPLRMVSSYLELLEKRYKGHLDERADKYIQFAIDGAVRMKRLINDLLTYSQLTRRPSSPARTNLNDALQNVLKNLEFLITESGSQIRHDPLPVLEVDATQVELLLQNLLSNAIKFRGEKRPQIQIEAQQTDREWVFSVCDNGIGIEPIYQEQIFTIFKRLHTREEYEGNGIGLAVCKRVVEQHNGRIWLESQLGQGTTFFFALPLPGEQ